MQAGGLHSRVHGLPPSVRFFALRSAHNPQRLQLALLNMTAEPVRPVHDIVPYTELTFSYAHDFTGTARLIYQQHIAQPGRAHAEQPALSVLNEDQQLRVHLSRCDLVTIIVLEFHHD